MSTFTKAALTLAAAGTVLTVATQPAAAAPTPEPRLTPQDVRVDGRAEAKSVDNRFSEEQVQVMARSAGRTPEQQRAYLARKTAQNNTYAELAQRHSYDGAFFTDRGDLVVQAAPGSRAAHEARGRGLQVRSPRFGEARLNSMMADVTRAGGDKMITASPDVQADRVVVTSADPAATRAALARFGDAVEVRDGERMRTHMSVQGGDKINMSAYGGGYCSAGFPAKTSDGRKLMVWAGHCIEGKNEFFKSGTRIGRAAATAFRSYDGLPDRDFGAVWMDAEDQMTTYVNRYGIGISQAHAGAWKAPVGTDMCKSGATSGITCGEVTGYNASVTYSDDQGRAVAQVSGLGTSTVCTAPGDSGGAYVSGNYAVGMTSGGPAVQTCSFNGGYLSGKRSYFQPVTDALNYYGITYGM